MFLNAFRFRLALMGVGFVTLLFYLMMGGRIGPTGEGVIQVEYGAYPEAFEGLQVAIDGKAAGELKRFGAATRTGFQVREGRHEVRVVSSRFTTRPRLVNVDGGRTVLLVLDFESGPAGKPVVYLQ
jgi:hypothetical protein